jgi:hypothetical protein
VHTLVVGDALVYNNHIVSLKAQLSCSPLPFPIIELTHKVDNIDDLDQGLRGSSGDHDGRFNRTGIFSKT